MGSTLIEPIIDYLKPKSAKLFSNYFTFKDFASIYMSMAYVEMKWNLGGAFSIKVKAVKRK